MDYGHHGRTYFYFLEQTCIVDLLLVLCSHAQATETKSETKSRNPKLYIYKMLDFVIQSF